MAFEPTEVNTRRQAEGLNGPSFLRHTLSIWDTVAIIVGIVIGAGIFKTPSVVAANSGTGGLTLLIWLAGGAISLVGALCYAELGSTYPHPGGDYHYLDRAFGRAPAFLFAWSRMAVIQTGSIAMLAFIVGDYASQVRDLGRFSSSLYAAATIALVTIVNVLGIRQGKSLQKILTAAIVLGLVGVLITGLLLAPSPVYANDVTENNGAIGKAMIFVLLTYGGWNEAAYISAEVQNSRRNIARALFYSIGIITAIYVCVNAVYLKGLGLSGTGASEAVAADLMRRAFGPQGVQVIALLVVIAVLSTMNGTIITGARTGYALGRDFPLFGFLGNWQETHETPRNALLVQSALALALVGFAAGSRSGFATMVEYTAPVFWLFLFLVAVALMVLRWKEPQTNRHFSVPFYPFTPLLFSAVCFFMLQSSLAYTGRGALVGIAVLIAGIPLFMMARSHKMSLNEKGGSQ